jgi:hypothetical protein
MPRGPRGERRPADVVANPVKVMRTSIGENRDDREDAPAPSPAAQLGKLGGAARAKVLTPQRRAEIARKAAQTRWKV